jgi:hypothetical protein
MNLYKLIEKAGFTYTGHEPILFTTSPDLRPHEKFGDIEVFRNTKEVMEYGVTEEKRFCGERRLSDRFIVSKVS